MTTMMMAASDDLPEFLKRSKGEVTKKFRAPRWKKMTRAERPKGERYEDAERYEVFIESTKSFLPKLGSGLRRLWVAEDETGARIVWLHDGETEAKLPMADWQRMSLKARRIG